MTMTFLHFIFSNNVIPPSEMLSNLPLTNRCHNSYVVVSQCLTLCGPVDCSPPGSSVGFPRQEYWSGLPFPSPADLPDLGIEPSSPAMAGGFFTTEPLGKPLWQCVYLIFLLHYKQLERTGRILFITVIFLRDKRVPCWQQTGGSASRAEGSTPVQCCTKRVPSFYRAPFNLV